MIRYSDSFRPLLFRDKLKCLFQRKSLIPRLAVYCDECKKLDWDDTMMSNDTFYSVGRIHVSCYETRVAHKRV